MSKGVKWHFLFIYIDNLVFLSYCPILIFQRYKIRVALNLFFYVGENIRGNIGRFYQ